MHALQRGENRPLSAQSVRVLVRSNFSVDVSALLLGPNRKVRSDADMIFYNQPVGPGVQHSGSLGEGDSILIDTDGVPREIERIAITASLDGTGPKTFGAAGHTSILIGNDLQFEIQGLDSERAIVCVEIYRRGEQWKVRAVGQGYAAGLAGIARDFGIAVEDEPSTPAPQAPPAPTPPPAAPSPFPQTAPSAPARYQTAPAFPQHQPPAPHGAGAAYPPAFPQPNAPAAQQQPAPQGAPRMQSELFSGQHAEVGGHGIQKQNGKMVRVGLNGEVIARSGSMVAYQGNMRFEALGSGGIGAAIRQRMAGEHIPLMKVSGQGDLFLANAAADVHIVDLDGTDGLTVNGANVLCYDSTLQRQVQRVQGAAAMGGAAGFFNSVFTGVGRIALTTEGYPVVLNVDAPTFADPAAAVAWSASLQTSVQRNDQLGLGTLIGRSTGERYTLAFQGRGFVIVQASEMPPGGLIGGAGGGDQAGSGGGGMLGQFLGR